MKIRVSMQGLPGAPTLLDHLEDAAKDAHELIAGVAFVTKGGVEAFFGRDSIARLAIDGTVDLIVGIDAVTDRAALEALADREALFPGLQVRVFRNPTSGLFHPKVFHFRKCDGGIESVCGSGNLTRGGLLHNLEAHTILRLSAKEANSAELSWLHGISSLEEHLTAIDADALAAADENRRPPAQGRRRRIAAVEAEASDEDSASTEDSLFLIGYVPKAGGRWTQLHLNHAVLPDFFRIPAVSGEPILLTHVAANGARGATETRQVVLSDTNQNVKVELGAAHGMNYIPRPIVLFKRAEARRFEYMLLMPGHSGHAELSQLLAAAPDSLGRGLTRVIRPSTAIQNAWPACPLL
jgi:HKD family nuclease